MRPIRQALTFLLIPILLCLALVPNVEACGGYGGAAFYGPSYGYSSAAYYQPQAFAYTQPVYASACAQQYTAPAYQALQPLNYAQPALAYSQPAQPIYGAPLAYSLPAVGGYGVYRAGLGVGYGGGLQIRAPFFNYGHGRAGFVRAPSRRY